jgi:hypothetical protein
MAPAVILPLGDTLISGETMMKSLTPLILLTFLSCASSDGFVGESTHQCSPGDPIEINVGFEGASAPNQDLVDDRVTLLVEIANNSDEDIVVESVRVDPQSPMSGQQRYELVGGSISPRRTIAEADAFLFRVPMTARRTDARAPRGFSGVAEVAVTVTLEGGTRYRCRYQVSR